MKNTSAWLEAITAARVAAFGEPPPGFKTRAAIQKEIGACQSATSKMIADMLKLGLAEMRKFKIQTPAGLHAVPHYRLKKPI